MTSAEDKDPVVGHKTFSAPDGGFRHEPLRASEASALMAAVEASRLRRKEQMPDERAAICALFDAYQRLKELGWADARYCPKDGREFDAIEIGSTGIHRCHYSGVWAEGSFWVASDGGLWPSNPVLYRVGVPPAVKEADHDNTDR